MSDFWTELQTENDDAIVLKADNKTSTPKQRCRSQLPCLALG